MKILHKKEEVETITLGKIGYGNCCKLQDGDDVYMYVKTTQTHVSIKKRSCCRPNMEYTSKLLCLETGMFIVVDVDIKVIAVDAVVCVNHAL